MKVLIVLTSHDQLGNTGRKTGFWLEEFAALPIKETVRPKILLQNAARFLGIELKS